MKPTGTEARICELIAQRQQMGIAKYGTTVEDNPLGLVQWLKHLRDEMLDGAVYAQRAIEQLEGIESALETMGNPRPIDLSGVKEVKISGFSESLQQNDPHAELRKTWKPGQKWQSLGEEGWVNLFFEPKWLPGTQYRRHPNDKDPSPEAEKPWYPDDSGEWVEVAPGPEFPPFPLALNTDVQTLSSSEREHRIWSGKSVSEARAWYWPAIVAYKVAK